MMIPQFSYLTLGVLLASIAFFMRAARFDHRPELVWGLLSFGSWVVFTSFVLPGVVGGVVSQVLLLVGITVFDYTREQRQLAREREDS